MFQRKKKVITVLVVTMLTLSLLAGCGGGSGGEGGGGEGGGGDAQIVMRLASNAPLDHMSNDLNEEACAMIEERTEGRVKVNYYPASQLGDYTTVYEEVMMGVVDFMHGTIPDQVDARLGVSYAPYYAMGFEDLPALYGPDSYLFDFMVEINDTQNVEFLGFLIEGFIGMGTLHEPTDQFVPGANKNFKMRAPGGLLTMLYPVQDLGYNAISIPYAEVPTSIQTGVVDGWSGGTPNMNYAWLGDVINYMYVNYMHAECTAYIGSQQSLAKLSPEDRQIVMEVFAEQSVKSFTVAEENEELYKELLAAGGVTVVEYTDEQLDTLAEYIRDVTWTRLEDDLTKEVVDRLREEVAKL